MNLAGAERQAGHLADWPLRPWVLAALLALCGLAIHVLTAGEGEDVPWRMGGGGFFFFGGIVAAFTLDERRLVGPAIFAAIVGLVMAGIVFNAIEMEDRLAGLDYAFAAGVFATLLAVPLFQAEFHRTWFRTPYDVTHFHVWSDAVSGAGALGFTGLSWLLLFLLDELFQLVGIEIIGTLTDEGWFGWMWSGAAFGAALGVLRNNLKIIGALQNVVLLVLSLLAVPLALALIVFLVALTASGGQALWDATDAATPVLLACAAGSFVLVNAVMREDDAARSGNVVLLGAGLVLTFGILPLAAFAAISMGLRIDQHGLSPERIWALFAIAVAVAYGLGGWVALARGRGLGWSPYLRSANLNLAAGVCVVALVLATPLMDFGAISARNQVARLQAGEVSPEDFDYAALRWDFGEAGRDMLGRLAAGEGKVAELAAMAQEQSDRFERFEILPEGRLTQAFMVYPSGSALPEGLKKAIASVSVCNGDVVCRVYLQEDGVTAAALGDGCPSPEYSREEQTSPSGDCTINAEPFVLADGAWQVARTNPPRPPMSSAEKRESLLEEREAIEAGDVRIAPARQRRIYVGGEPVGRLFE